MFLHFMFFSEKIQFLYMYININIYMYMYVYMLKTYRHSQKL